MSYLNVGVSVVMCGGGGGVGARNFKTGIHPSHPSYYLFCFFLSEQSGARALNVHCIESVFIDRIV